MTKAARRARAKEHGTMAYLRGKGLSGRADNSSSPSLEVQYLQQDVHGRRRSRYFNAVRSTNGIRGEFCHFMA
jgi:hypothetical protein